MRSSPGGGNKKVFDVLVDDAAVTILR